MIAVALLPAQESFVFQVGDVPLNLALADGVEQIVTVTADGFEWQGRPYRSLSAIARAITGTRWNGWVFFGLKNHRGRT